MNRKDQIHKLVEEAIDSIEHIQKASPKPFLLTRIDARLHRKNFSLWEKASWLIARPSFAIPGLVILIMLNVMTVLSNENTSVHISTEQQSGLPATDDFAYTDPGIYDIENTEQ
ncbi:MAG: hypothetical protein ABIN01_04040 [Ferruginibacter sp.]